VSLRQTLVALLVIAALGGSFILMVDDAAHGGDWPGWDEGWVLVAFPLGIPIAVAAAVGLGGKAVQAASARIVVMVTGAVWLWGAAIFAVWLLVGN
jgi:small-conductance mechanosensitive channel